MIQINDLAQNVAEYRSIFSESCQLWWVRFSDVVGLTKGSIGRFQFSGAELPPTERLAYSHRISSVRLGVVC